MNFKKIISILTAALMLPAALVSCAAPSGPAGTTGSDNTSDATAEPAETVIVPPEEALITSKVVGLRDPFVLRAKSRYYMYGTGWTLYRSSGNKLDGRWVLIGDVVEKPADFGGSPWAPEVYAYGGAYYMFTTYSSTATGKHGCAVFRADQPEGPFTLHSDGHVTPSEWDAIDGTLFIDKDGRPWMVFVHEWVSTDDNIGRMACARMSDDLRSFVSEPVELFRATDAPWHTQGVTDGCFVHTLSDGSLIMIWSNWDSEGYCVGMAKSPSGEVTGPWEQLGEPLFSKSILGDYDGGHGMIFTDFDGRTWLTLHSPNDRSAGRAETPVFIPIKEEDGRLVWDLSKTVKPGEK